MGSSFKRTWSENTRIKSTEMAKATEQTWAKAKAMYEKGTSLRAIELETENEVLNGRNPS